MRVLRNESMVKEVLFTVGHSNRSIEEFVDLVLISSVTAIADVRSQPYSRRMPHFNQNQLCQTLQNHGIAYVFLGEELGARRNELCCYVDGQAKYELIEKTAAFESGLKRLRRGVQSHRIAIMCAERDPLTCHRSILIAKALRDELDIRHIITRDEIESHKAAENRLLRIWGLGRDLFESSAEMLEDAYRKQANRIAYVKNGSVRAPGVNQTDD